MDNMRRQPHVQKRRIRWQRPRVLVFVTMSGQQIPTVRRAVDRRFPLRAAAHRANPSAFAGQNRPALRFSQMGQSTNLPVKNASQPEYHAMMTLLWNRRAAITNSSDPIANSASASSHRCDQPAPRRIMPRVMLMKYVAGTK